MTDLALIRHGPTAWTEAARIQGRADPPLSAAGRGRVAAWRLPEDVAASAWVSSPLRRATETAALLGKPGVATDSRLVEMDWGAWEGRRLADLRRELGAAMRENEALGLDFHPDGGETPRQVQERLRPWLARVAAAGEPTLAVTHKGVIRAVLALATGWDMSGPAPARLAWSALHVFALEAGGALRARRLNVPLEAP